MSDKGSVSIEGAVRTVTLTRPEKGNAMDAEMLRALEDAFDPDEVRAVAEYLRSL